VLLLYISISPVHCAKIVGVTSSDGFLICVLLFVLYMVRYDGELCFPVVHPSVRACVWARRHCWSACRQVVVDDHAHGIAIISFSSLLIDLYMTPIRF